MRRLLRFSTFSALCLGAFFIFQNDTVYGNSLRILSDEALMEISGAAVNDCDCVVFQCGGEGGKQGTCKNQHAPNDIPPDCCHGNCKTSFCDEDGASTVGCASVADKDCNGEYGPNCAGDPCPTTPGERNKLKAPCIELAAPGCACDFDVIGTC